MARDYGRIRSQFWPDEKVQAWSMAEKGFASYLLTSEHATALGAYRLPIAYMCADLGIQAAEARSYVAALMKADFIAYDEKSGWIWIKKYLTHNRSENANVWKHVRTLAASIPDSLPFKAEVLGSIEHHSKGSKNCSQTVSEGETGFSQEPNLAEPNPTEPTQDARARNFDAAWKAYPHPGNASRALAEQAWDQLGDELPPIAQLMVAIDLYRGWLNAETKRRPPHDPPPIMHFANWLKERRFESFLGSAEQDAERAAEADRKRFEGMPACWRGCAEVYVEAHGAEAWDHAVANAKLKESDAGPVIEFDRPWSLNFAREQGWLERMARALGHEPSVTVRGGKPPKAA